MEIFKLYYKCLCNNSFYSGANFFFIVFLFRVDVEGICKFQVYIIDMVINGGRYTLNCVVQEVGQVKQCNLFFFVVRYRTVD